MWSRTFSFCGAVALAVLSSPASADSLGFRFADVTVAGVAGDGDVLGHAQLSTDFAITDAHGLQLDLGVTAYDGEFLGQIDGHLYMMPTPAAKYGLFFSLADMDGREATIAFAGVEGMFAVADRTEVHGRAGIGMALPGDMDFITLSAGASHAVSSTVAVFGDVMVTEVDEADLRAIGTSARLGVSYQPDGRPWDVTASVVHDGVTGRDAAAFETRAEIGFTWHFGAGGGAKRSLSARGFANAQPFDALLRRGMF
jgi:hypothetical protein